MSKDELVGTIGWFVMVGIIGSSTVSILLDLGVEQPAYIVDWKFLLSGFLFMAGLAISAYMAGKSKRS